MEEAEIDIEQEKIHEKFVNNALALPSLPIFMRIDLNSKLKSKKVKSDCCQRCKMKFTSETMVYQLRRTGKGKKKVVKVVITCSSCKTTTPGAKLPKLDSRKGKSNKDSRATTMVEPPKPVVKKSAPLPNLTQKQKKASRANRLNKMVAAMEKSEPPKVSSLGDFLSSLGSR